MDIGASATTAASILSVIGGISIAGRFIMGIASDRIGNKRAYIICFIFLAAAFIILSVIQKSWALYLFAVLYGFAHGGLWVLISPMVAELFGIGSHGVIFGVIYFAVTLGGTISPFLAGYIFDITSSYQVVFFSCSILGLIAIILAVFLTPTTYMKTQISS